jgi:hypothetical protein
MSATSLKEGWRAVMELQAVERVGNPEGGVVG